MRFSFSKVKYSSHQLSLTRLIPLATQPWWVCHEWASVCPQRLQTDGMCLHEKNLNSECSLKVKYLLSRSAAGLFSEEKTIFLRMASCMMKHFLHKLCLGSCWHLCTSSLWSEHQMALPVDHEETIDTQLLTSRSHTSFPLLELVLKGIKGCKPFVDYYFLAENIWGTLEQRLYAYWFESSWSLTKFESFTM